MARARNIKPGLFVNDELAEVEPLGRLLFIGLWTIADREGRLKDKPKRIKTQTLPYDDCNIDDLLNQLQEHGFIMRYEANGCKCIQILNFNKHQNPHHQEKDSELPSPDNNEISSEVIQDKTGSNRADSLNLIPESLNPQSGESEPNKSKKFKPPTVEQINEYCKERNNGLDAQKIHDHYTAKGWYIGKNKMKDWQAAVRTWERNHNNKEPTVKYL